MVPENGGRTSGWTEGGGGGGDGVSERVSASAPSERHAALTDSLAAAAG